MNNIKSSTDSDNSNDEYNINNNNNRNNIVTNSRISDSINWNIYNNDSENNIIITNNILNSLIGENRVNLSNFMNESVNIYVTCGTNYITFFLVKEMQIHYWFKL